MESPRESQPSRFGVLPGERNGNESDASETLQRVRDLLFGEAARAQEARTEALDERLQSEVERLGAEMESRIAALHSSVDERFAGLGQRIDARFAALEADLAARFSALDTEVDARLAALRADVQTDVEALRTTIAGQKADKVERSDLRQVLAELAERIAPAPSPPAGSASEPVSAGD